MKIEAIECICGCTVRPTDGNSALWSIKRCSKHAATDDLLAALRSIADRCYPFGSLPYANKLVDAIKTIAIDAIALAEKKDQTNGGSR